MLLCLHVAVVSSVVIRVVTAAAATSAHAPDIINSPLAHSDESFRDAYSKYLREAEKELDRLIDARRLRAFAAAFRRVAAAASSSSADIGTSRDAGASATRPYRLALNEFADWLPEEIAARFPPFPLNISSSLGPFAGGIGDAAAADASRTLRDEGAAYLNWATSQNPLGYSVVSPVHNQGACGACWAFVAAGSAEGSVRIAQASRASSGSGSRGGTGASTGDAAGPPPLPLSLSVQELIDCDRGFNRGCAGGNPMYAYQYIMSFGLGQWTDYPYKTQQDPTCLRDAPQPSSRSSRSSRFALARDTDVPIPTSSDRYGVAVASPYRVTIDSYVVAPPNNEALLMRYVDRGPVAIGICGTDPELLLYAGGIFNSNSCCTIQNHAVLLVGYGYDESLGLDFWIAKNSWGKYWGENGYFRILRSAGGVVGYGGLCGLAAFPTMAVGGHALSGSSDGRGDVGASTGGGASGERSWMHGDTDLIARFRTWVEGHNEDARYLAGTIVVAVIAAALFVYLKRGRGCHRHQRPEASGEEGAAAAKPLYYYAVCVEDAEQVRLLEDHAASKPDYYGTRACDHGGA